MRHWFIITLTLIVSFCLHAQNEAPSSQEPASEEPVLPISEVHYQLKNKTWFTDRAASAVVWFEEPVEEPEHWSDRASNISILEISLPEAPDSKTGKYAAVVRYLPRKVGTVKLPALTFTSETKAYQTQPIDIIVSEPQVSEGMSLTLKPQKHTVYVGEPLKVHLTWDCSINAAQLQSLKLYPSFFNDSNIQVVIPRNSADEKSHVGIPIGGRRVIATRTRTEADTKALGRIDLPLYLRFNEPGTFTLPETRLECALLERSGSDFARYAAHFNNALFESVDSDQAYKRIYTTAPSIEIEVLPLPINTTGHEFSGLYAPIDFEVTAKPTEIEIGQIMEIEIKASGHAPHGMIELPKLGQQRGLRERFLVDNDLGRIWHEEGTTFRTRLRPLSTTIQAFPSLQFLILDPTTGSYETYNTTAIPLKTKPSNGQQFIPLKNYKGAAVTLTNQPEGIWHNLKANRMNDLLNSIFDLLSRNFWLFMLLGPILFFCLLPLVRELRRRANDRNYRLRAEAYKQFKAISSNSPEKWPAFLHFMAAHFGSTGKSWTLSNSIEALQSIDATSEEIEHITTLHRAADARDFSEEHPDAEFAQLESVAKRVLKGISHVAIALLVVNQLFTNDLHASDWSEAEQLFTQAQVEAAGSDTATTLYKQAALKFQAEAAVNKHPGESWANAGNAWFQAGAVGRAIAAYHSALNYRPFDVKLTENLAAARAMTLNDIPKTKHWWQQLPTRWLKTIVVIINFIFWATLLLTIRYQGRRLYIATAVCAACLLIVSIFLLQQVQKSQTAGVVVVDTLYAKKGPSHAYAKAFNEPLHDGTEFILIEDRGEWSHVELSDGRQCWLLSSQTTTYSW